MRVNRYFSSRPGILGVAKASPIADWLTRGRSDVFLMVAALIALVGAVNKVGQSLIPNRHVS